MLPLSNFSTHFHLTSSYLPHKYKFLNFLSPQALKTTLQNHSANIRAFPITAFPPFFFFLTEISLHLQPNSSLTQASSGKKKKKKGRKEGREGGMEWRGRGEEKRKKNVPFSLMSLLARISPWTSPTVLVGSNSPSSLNVQPFFNVFLPEASVLLETSSFALQDLAV